MTIASNHLLFLIQVPATSSGKANLLDNRTKFGKLTFGGLSRHRPVLESVFKPGIWLAEDGDAAFEADRKL